MKSNPKKCKGSVLIDSAMIAAFLLGMVPQTTLATQRVDNVQQNVSVLKGTVVDANGEPIIGASVTEDGTQNGTVTDLNGHFSLSHITSGNLTISYIGFQTAHVSAKGKSSVDIVMKEDNKTLNEVVVVGFGTQKKVNLTGAVAVVDGDELAQRPVMTATQALQGVVPGLQISATGGSLEATSSINVRGTGTIGQGSSGSPLILIDGVEGDLNTINPQDIESISVLKDAAASSIYGSRAPFGVILVTTKGGDNNGKVTVNYNNSFRWSSLIREKHMMNSVDFASWMNDANTNSGSGVFYDDQRMKDIVAYHNASPVSPGVRRAADGTLLYALPIKSDNPSVWADGYAEGIDDVDWYDVVYKNTTFAMEHNASISGGNKKFNYYTSFNYLDNNGFMKLNTDTYNRYNATAKINAEITPWARMSYNMRWTRTDYERPAALTNSLYSDMARQGWPTLPLYDRNGYYYSATLPVIRSASSSNPSKTGRHTSTSTIRPITAPVTGTRSAPITTTWPERRSSTTPVPMCTRTSIRTTTSTSRPTPSIPGHWPRSTTST